jgi:hypothetical protein
LSGHNPRRLACSCYTFAAENAGHSMSRTGFLETVMLRSVLLSFAACVLLAGATYADVYKYTDEKGKVLYTDKPQFLPAEKLSIKSDSTNIVDLDERNDEETATQTTRDTARKETAENAADKKKVKEGKAEACAQARKDYLARMNAQRLYEEGSKGERRYLTDKELESSRATAKQAMDALCN